MHTNLWIFDIATSELFFILNRGDKGATWSHVQATSLGAPDPVVCPARCHDAAAGNAPARRRANSFVPKQTAGSDFPQRCYRFADSRRPDIE